MAWSEFWNEKIETMPPGELQAFQEEALWKQLDHVRRNSVFYQKKYAEEGIDLGDVRTVADFEKLPFTSKYELRDSQIEAPPLGTHAAVPMGQVGCVYSTSGTTGRPTYIGLTRNDQKVWAEASGRAIWCCGLKPDSVVPLIVAPFLIAASYANAIQHIGATVVPIGVGATDRVIGAYQNLGANAFLATTSFPMHFADSLRKRGIDPASLGIKHILAGGEPGASIPEYREMIEQTYNAVMLEAMGNGDMAGHIFAECSYKKGMHFTAAGIVYIEIIDPDTGAVLKPETGVRGELVYTSLDRECMPLVRFRTRDHVEVTHTSCECGRTGFGIRCIGRTDDMIIVQGVNVYPSAVKDLVSAFAPRTSGAMEIQITQEPPRGWDPPIWIKVEEGEQPGDQTALKKELEALIREKLIFRAAIEVVPMDSLPKFEYKAKLVRKVYEEQKQA